MEGGGGGRINDDGSAPSDELTHTDHQGPGQMVLAKMMGLPCSDGLTYYNVQKH